MADTTKWTLVRHSAWTVNRDPQFEHAVETTSVTNVRIKREVLEKGGLLFDDYDEASEIETQENYPRPDEQGLIPEVAGTFALYMVEGAQLYRPPYRRPHHYVTSDSGTAGRG